MTRLAAIDDIPDMRPLRVEHEGRGILLCRDEHGRVHAIDELCPHKGLSMAWGAVLQGHLICPWHQYAFNLETGRCSRRCAPAEVIEIDVRDGAVYLTA